MKKLLFVLKGIGLLIAIIPIIIVAGIAELIAGPAAPVS